MGREAMLEVKESALGSAMGQAPPFLAALPGAATDTVDGPRVQSIAELLPAIQKLEDAELMRWLACLNRRKQVTDANLLACLSEIDRRKLYREEACPNFFDYLTRRLGYSEDVAYRRMWCCRMLREYPLIEELLRAGRIHQAALLLLKPHLTQENHRERLMACVGKSKREVERLVACFAPKPDAPTLIRRQPRVASTAVSVLDGPSLTSSAPSSSGLPLEPFCVAAESKMSNATTASGAPESNAPSSSGLPLEPFCVAAESKMSNATTASGAPESNAPIATTRSVAPTALPDLETLPPQQRIGGAATSKVAPLSHATYRVSFTANQSLKEKIERAGALVSHAMNPRDLPTLIERALDLLIEKEERRRFGGSHSGRHRRHASSEAEATRAVRAPASTQNGDVMQGARALTGVSGAVAKESSSEAEATESTSDVNAKAPAGEAPAAVARVETGGTKKRLSSSYIPSAVRRMVWKRDSGQCTYVSPRGERCGCRHHLQFDHRIARALGGRSTVDNLRLRCAAHNALAAEQVFGKDRIENAIANARARANQ